LAGRCLERGGARAETIVSYPPELLAWWIGNGRVPPPVPPLRADCSEREGHRLLQIRSPGRTSEYRIRRDTPLGDQSLPLAATAGGVEGSLYWYQDGELVARVGVGRQAFLPLAPGRHHLVVVDDAGASDAVDYVVR
jgi:membrane carboxypeptidase/penicillin-binding protein PbpC